MDEPERTADFFGPTKYPHNPLREENQRLKSEIDGLRAMIARSGDICPCRECGEPVICASEGIAICFPCVEKEQ